MIPDVKLNCFLLKRFTAEPREEKLNLCLSIMAIRSLARRELSSSGVKLEALMVLMRSCDVSCF